MGLRRLALTEGGGKLRDECWRSGGCEPGALDQIQGRGSERRIVEELDRQTALPHEKLRSRNVHRASGLERAHGVNAAGGEVTERECERPHHP